MTKTKITVTAIECFDTKDLEMLVRAQLRGLDIEDVKIEYVQVPDAPEPDDADIAPRDVNPSGRAPFGWHI